VIIDLPTTNSSKINKALVDLREKGGSIALGRVLTLVIVTEEAASEDPIAAANAASFEHPCRVIVVARGSKRASPRLDAQIRVGGDAGASEVIVLRAYGETASDEEGLVTGLLLPDAPVVVWWPGIAPAKVSHSPLGRIATCRITDASAQPNPQEALYHLAETYAPGDTDFAWTRLTLWRAQLAAVLDQPPYEPITSVEVAGAADSPSTLLLAAWLRLQLQVPVQYDLASRAVGSGGIHGVRMERASGTIELEREVPNVARLSQPGQPSHDLALPRRSLRDCLAEELRRLDPDDLYGEVITQGLGLLETSDEGAGAHA
jgi:glucose-6-phosphate dehydrogenase assembly protein OpcA